MQIISLNENEWYVHNVGFDAPAVCCLFAQIMSYAGSVDMCLPVFRSLRSSRMLSVFLFPCSVSHHTFQSCSSWFSSLAQSLCMRVSTLFVFGVQFRVYNLLFSPIWLFHLIKRYVLFQLVHWYYLCALHTFHIYHQCGVVRPFHRWPAFMTRDSHSLILFNCSLLYLNDIFFFFLLFQFSVYTFQIY